MMRWEFSAPVVVDFAKQEMIVTIGGHTAVVRLDDAALQRIALAGAAGVIEKKPNGASAAPPMHAPVGAYQTREQTEALLLADLEKHGPSSVGEIRARLDWRPTKGGRVIARLVDRGVVLASADEGGGDHRRLRLANAPAQLPAAPQTFQRGGTSQAVRDADVIVAFLMSHKPKTMTRPQLGAHFGWKPDKCLRAVKEAMRSGRVAHDGTTYRVTGAGEQTSLPLLEEPRPKRRLTAAAKRANAARAAATHERVDAEGKAVAELLRSKTGEAWIGTEIRKHFGWNTNRWFQAARVAIEKYGVHRAIAGGPPTARYSMSKRTAERASALALEEWSAAMHGKGGRPKKVTE